MADYIPAPARQVEQHFTVDVEYFEDNFSPDAGRLRLATHESRHGIWRQGDFVDYRGIVTIQTEQTYLRLDAVAEGRWHIRTYQRGFADRTISKLCRAFLTDLHGAPAHD